MSAPITTHHRQRPAYIYVRQSTLGQVRHHQESTERQYALRAKAQALGWPDPLIQVLDGDLGQSGTCSAPRQDFKTLVTEVSMDRVGAVFALEVSRLARSNADWQRLLELCALTHTLVIDEDGCYDPSDFNDGLLLGLKGTMAQAELHFLRARLLGGKLNKAAKGELHHPLPVGLVYAPDGQIVLDEDAEVRGAIERVFHLFRDTGSAYGVVKHFAAAGLHFPKRAYGGAWDGRLVWGRLSHARVLGILRNPAYAGAYVYGRYQYRRQLTAEGELRLHTTTVPQEAWQVNLQQHHEGYIDWETYLANQQQLARNCTLSAATVLSGPAREGLALLQGLLVCGACGRRVTLRYQGNGGLYPVYLCNGQRREARGTCDCFCVRCDVLDTAVSEQVLALMQPSELALALSALEELQTRDTALQQQWQRRLQRAEYEAQLAERRYAEVDPAHRLVAATLEQRWNVALQRLAEVQQACELARQQARRVTPEQRAQILALAEDFPRLWAAPTTAAKDRKRLLRLLIKDITVERLAPKQLQLHIRWQGGALSDVPVTLPPSYADQVRYPAALVEHIRTLAMTLDDQQIAEQLNQEGRLSPKGHPFSLAMIRWVRYKHDIPAAPRDEDPDGLTVDQVAAQFGVSHHVVYYWIEHGLIIARPRQPGRAYRLDLSEAQTQRLHAWVANSPRLTASQPSEPAL